MSEAKQQIQSQNKKTALILSGVVVAMFGFGFALVPLYDLICSVTGIQSISLRSGTKADVLPTVQSVATSNRQVTVKFDATINPNLPWDLTTEMQQMVVRPGKVYEINYVASNRSSARVVGQAIPSVVPWQATPYFSKLECFCFNKQQLTGGETVKMPLRFMVSQDLPEDIRSLTLSYSFMKLQDQSLVTQNLTNPN